MEIGDYEPLSISNLQSLIILMEKPTIITLIDGLGMGGAERLLIPYLRYLQANGFALRVCALQERHGNPLAAEVAALGVPVDLLPVPYLRDITAVPRLIAYFRQHQADLVHTQLELANTLGTVAAAMLRLPTVCTLHTIDELQPGSKTARRIRLMWWVLRHFCQRIVAVSEETRQHHIATAKFAPAQVVTLYNGIDLSHFEPRDLACQTAVRTTLKIPAHAKLLTTVAVLRQPKGIQFMLDAMPAVLTAVPDAHYLIVGDGDYRPELEAQMAQLAIDERVHFAGQRRDVADLLAASDLFVLPTLTDALPTVLMEAMALHLPLLATAVGGVPEMVQNGYNGLLVPPGSASQLAQATIALLQDEAKRREMGENGRLLVEQKFNIQRQAAELASLYRTLLS
ncbi:MAG: glycosyltransferase [Anaerolineales bacterium]|nr:glycosyltransferase [Anaerolineales bacterium]